jgi:two-component sensor histidine kinase
MGREMDDEKVLPKYAPVELSWTSEFQHPSDCPRSHCVSFTRGRAELERLQRSEADLERALARERSLIDAQEQLLLQNQLLSRESDHRLLNGLQMVSSLLSAQSRKTSDPEVSAQLKNAATRVTTVAQVHRLLHVLDNIRTVEIKEYLTGLCGEFGKMLAETESEKVIVFDGITATIPTTTAIPLAFIVSELVTNSAKYGADQISVCMREAPGLRYAFSVADNGRGLPDDFDPRKTTGLGMMLISTLVRNIGGELIFGPNVGGCGTIFTVLIPAPQLYQYPLPRPWWRPAP